MPSATISSVGLLSSARARMQALWLADETACVETLQQAARLDHELSARVQERATRLVETVRQQQAGTNGLDAFLREYGLSSHEGVVLMCLAEALLRIPDDGTADRLIADRLQRGDWDEHLGASSSLFVNASTWSLMLAGRLLRLDDAAAGDLSGYMKRLVSRASEPVVRQALRHAMRVLGRQFVMGRTIDEALQRSHGIEQQAYRHSFDMLGEAAVTALDAERYLASYRNAIAAVGADARRAAQEANPPGISVKLSPCKWPDIGR